jgi:predicted GNAT family acetyltransferase
METAVTDNSEENRYEITADGELAGYSAYQPLAGGLAFTHTEIDERMEGKGLGSKLISEALDDARGRGLSVLPFCPFVRGYIERHPDYADLVPEPDRARFGLG